jgi:hypothetical protein
VRGVEDVGRVVQLAGLGGADKPGQVVAAAEVAGVADARERGGEARVVGGDAEMIESGDDGLEYATK